MAIKSVFWPDPPVEAGRVRISGDEHEHLRVARTAPGECVELFDGAGRMWTCEVVDVEKHATSVRVIDQRAVPPPGAEIVLGQALIRNAAFERVLERSVEVGVTRIVPFRANRSNDSGKGRERRWRKIIIEAAKQSKQYHLPVLEPATDFERVLAYTATSRVIFAEHGGGALESALTGAPAFYLIGPEGGWTDDELGAAAGAGFRAVTLGAHILRSETAAVVAAGLIAHQLGVL